MKTRLTTPKNESGTLHYLRNFDKSARIILFITKLLFICFFVVEWIVMSQNTATRFIEWGNVYTLLNDPHFEAYATVMIAVCAIGSAAAILYPMLQQRFVSDGKKRTLCQCVVYICYALVALSAALLCISLDGKGLTISAAMISLVILPVICCIATLAQNCVLNKICRRYDDALNKYSHTDVSDENSTMRLNKNIGMCSLLLAAALCIALPTGFAVKPIMSADIEAVSIGDSRQHVGDLLGAPYEEAQNYNIYYGNKFDNLSNKTDKLNKLLRQKDYSSQKDEIRELITELDNLMNSVKDEYVVVNFDEFGFVTGLFASRKVNIRQVSSDIIDQAVGDNGVVDVALLDKGEVSVRTWYADGSYSLGAVPLSCVTSDQLLRNGRMFPKTALLSWGAYYKDYYVTFSQRVHFDESNLQYSWKVQDGTLVLSGERIPSRITLNVFGALPWAGQEITTVKLADDVVYVPDISTIVPNPLQLKQIEVSENNAYYTSDNGILFNKDCSAVCYVPAQNVNLDKTAWWKTKSDGPVYQNNVLYGYKGEIPSGYALTVADGTTRIENNAFRGCQNLGEITCCTSLNELGMYCLSDTGISKLIVDENINFVEDKAFADNSALTEIQWLAKQQNYDKSIMNIQSFSNTAFDGCTTAQKLTVGENVKDSLRNNVFGGLTNVTKLQYNAQAVSVGSNIFAPLSLSEVTIGKRVRSLPTSVFGNCIKLEKIIYEGDIDGWASIEFANDSANPLLYGRNLFIDGNVVTDVELHDATKISPYAFVNSSIKTLTTNDKVQSIGANAFAQCTKLISADIGNSVVTIGENAFAKCTELISANIGNGVIKIGENAFADDTFLLKLTIGSAVEQIDRNAFNGCVSLVEILNKSALKLTKGDANNYGGVAAYALNLYTLQAGGSKLSSTDDLVYLTEEGEDENTLMLVKYLGTETLLLIPDELGGSNITIAANAFAGTKVTAVHISPNVKIVKNAFAQSDITQLFFEGNGDDYKQYPDSNNIASKVHVYWLSDDQPTKQDFDKHQYWWHWNNDHTQPVVWEKPQA